MNAVEPPDPDQVAAAVLAVPGVARLHGGLFGEVATYLPGRRVTGVQVGGDRVGVHVAGLLGMPIPELVAAVRAAAAPLVGGLPIDVVVEDVVMPEDSTADEHG